MTTKIFFESGRTKIIKGDWVRCDDNWIFFEERDGKEARNININKSKILYFVESFGEKKERTCQQK